MGPGLFENDIINTFFFNMMQEPNIAAKGN